MGRNKEEDKEWGERRGKVTCEAELITSPTAMPASGLARCEFMPRQAHRGLVSGETGLL